jgi:hypothetical protein
MRRSTVRRLPWGIIARRACVAVLLVLGVFTTCHRLGAPAMWLDEIYHRSIGFNSVHEIVKREFFMQFCVGYYLINRWTEALISNPDVAVRLPQAVSAVFTLLLAYLLGRHAFSTGAGLLAMFWLAVSPLFIRYAQENRFYQMGSMAALATYYMLVRFIETRRWPYLLGLLAASVVLMHTYTYGFVFVGMCVPLMLFLLVMTWIAGPADAPYHVDRRLFWGLGIWALVIAVQWAPLGWRVGSWLLSGDLVGVSGAKQGGATFDAWWTAPFQLTPQALLTFVKNECSANAFVYDHAVRYGSAIAAALLGCLVWRRGRMLVCLLFFYLVTLGLIHVSNMTQSVVMPKRFLYLYPVFVVMVSGGVAVLVEAGCHLVQRLRGTLPHEMLLARSRWIAPAVRVALWLLMLRWFVLPPVRGAVHDLTQYYYTERAPFKLLGRVLQQHMQPGEPLWWHPPNNDGWLIGAYLTNEFAQQRVDMAADSVTRAQIAAALATNGALWLHQIDPIRVGIAPALCVRIPLYDRVTWLVRAAYSNNPACRAAEQEQVLRTALATARYPEPAAAGLLAATLLARGATNDADAVIAQQARFRWSYAAAVFALDYYSNRCELARGASYWAAFADRFFWVPEYQARAVTLALQQGDAVRARRFARRYQRWADDRDAYADEWIAAAYRAESNYPAAIAWLAHARCAAASPARRGDIMRLREQWAREWRLDATLDTWHAAWTQSFAIIQLDDWFALLDQLRAQPGLWQRLVAYGAARHVHIPSHATLRTATEAQALRASASAAWWPVYAYLIERATPTNLMAEAIVPWRDLEQRGFPPLATMSDAAVWWLVRFYRDRLAPDDWRALTQQLATHSAARAAGTVATCAPLAAALQQWRAAYILQDLPWLLRKLRAALSNTLTAAYAARLVRTTLGAAPPTNVTPTTTAAVLCDTVTRNTWPLYIMTLDDMAAGGRAAQFCVPPERLAQIGFPPLAQMSDATVLWFDRFYARYGNDTLRIAFYQELAAAAPSRRAWADARRATLTLPHNHHSSTNIPTL